MIVVKKQWRVEALRASKLSRQFSKRALLAIFSAAAMTLGISKAAQAEYYAYDVSTHSISHSPDGDPDQVKPLHWEVWLYKRGAPVDGSTTWPNRWGVIEGDTAEQVMAEWKDDADAEHGLLKLLGLPDNYHIFTEQFPLGPIAITRSIPPSDNQVLAAYDRIDAAYQKIQQARDIYNNAVKLAEGSTDPEKTNPFGHVGETLRDYGDALSNAAEKLSNLSHELDTLTYPNIQEVNTALDGVNSDLQNANQTFKATGDELGAFSGNESGNGDTDNTSGDTNPDGQYVGDMGIPYTQKVQIDSSGIHLTMIGANSVTYESTMTPLDDILPGGYGTTYDADWHKTSFPNLDVGCANGYQDYCIKGNQHGLDQLGHKFSEPSTSDHETIFFHTLKGLTSFVCEHWPKADIQAYREDVAGEINCDTSSDSSDNVSETLATTTQVDGTKVTSNPNGKTIDGRIDFPDGSTYIGNLTGNLPDGQGELLLKNGETYVGEFKNGVSPTGMGDMKYPNGSHYQGQFLNGNAVGTGVLISPTAPDLSGAWQGDHLTKADPPMVTEGSATAPQPQPGMSPAVPQQVGLPFMPFSSDNVLPHLIKPITPRKAAVVLQAIGVAWNAAGAAATHVGATLAQAQDAALESCNQRFGGCVIASVGLDNDQPGYLSIAQLQTPLATRHITASIGIGINQAYSDLAAVAECERADGPTSVCKVVLSVPNY